MVELSEPFPENLLPRLFAWLKHLIKAPMLDDFAPQDAQSFVRLMRAGGYRSWAVTVDGEVSGFVSYQPRNAVGGTAWFVFRPEAQKHAEEAVRNVLRQLFIDGDVRRVQFLLMRRGRGLQDSPSIAGILKRMGGKCEGVMLGSTMRGGELMDESVWAISRASFLGGKQDAGISVAVGDDGGGRNRERAGEPQEGADLRTDVA